MKAVLESIALLALCCVGVYSVAVILGDEIPGKELSLMETIMFRVIALFSLLGIRSAGMWIIKQHSHDRT